MPEEQRIENPTAPRSILEHTDDFVSRYANNIQVESNAFDLKMIFGILDQSAAARGDLSTPPKVEQHTSINISWVQVKLLMFWLRVHLNGYENDNGKVQVPNAALPPDFPQIQLPKHIDAKKWQESIERIRKMRAEFIERETGP